MNPQRITVDAASVRRLAQDQGVTLSLDEAGQVLTYVLGQPLTVHPDEALREALAAIRAFQAGQQGGT